MAGTNNSIVRTMVSCPPIPFTAIQKHLQEQQQHENLTESNLKDISPITLTLISGNYF